MNRVFFVVSFAAALAALSAGAPQARSQQYPIIPRMSVTHGNAQNHFSLLDPTQPPSAGGPAVGHFLSSVVLGNELEEGYAYPDQSNPQFLYGVISGGQGIRRVSTAGAPMDTTSFGSLLTRITGAWRVKSVVPSPQWLPSGHDLVDHYVVVGDTSLGGYNTGMILVNPATMTPFQIGLGSAFLMPTLEFQDVCFGVYAGPDGSYGTNADNQYRYVTIYQIQGTNDSGLFVLSLNKHETMNGQDPPPDFDPVQPTRGPSYTNAYPLMTSNSITSSLAINSEPNGQLYCKSWYARPGIAGFGLTSDRTYVIAGWVQEFFPPPSPFWGPVIQGYDLGTGSPIVSVTGSTGPSQGFGQLTDTDDLFHSMTLVGDWLICALGDGGGSGMGSNFQAVYIPEFLDGPGDGDNGVRAAFQPAGGSGRAGYHPTVLGAPSITYLGTGSTIAYGTTLSPLQNHVGGAGLLSSMTSIDMHTQEEQMLGLTVRQDPQPFVGYWTLEDPADTFPGSVGGGGGGGGGGCSKSAGGGAGSTAGVLSLVGVAFLLAQLMREARGPRP